MLFLQFRKRKNEHLFWHCNVVNQFWDSVEQWIFDKSYYMVNVNKYRAIMGIPNTSAAMQPINYILIFTHVELIPLI